MPYRYPGEKYPEGSRLSNATPFESAPIADREKACDTLDTLALITKQREATVAQVALNWLRKKPGVTSVVIGATKMSQLEDNLAAVEWELSSEEMVMLDAVSNKEKP